MSAADDMGHGSYALGRHRLGGHLRQLRQACGLRLEDVAATLDLAVSTVSRIETGKAPVRTSYLNMMLDLYGVTDPEQRSALCGLARQGQAREWWATYSEVLPAGFGPYLGLEAAASQARLLAVPTVPDLLQTQDYAAAVYQARQPDLAPGKARELAMLTLRRREHMNRAGLRLHAVIDESALRRHVGSTAIMAEQLRFLAEVTASALVTVQVMPLATAWPVLSPPFTLLDFSGSDALDVACTPTLGGKLAISARETDVRALGRAFSMLARTAMPASDSRCLIKRLTARS